MRGGFEIEKTDSTVKPIAEPYLLASVNFYRTAIVLKPVVKAIFRGFGSSDHYRDR